MAFLIAFVVVAVFALDVQAFLQSTNVVVTRAVPSGQTKLCPKHTTKSRTRKTFLAVGGPSDGLKVAVVGAGPSGLLLSHLLRTKGGGDGDSDNGFEITLFDGRSDPRSKKLDGRAYALGIGMRGRTAIRTAGPALWNAVKSRGYESERFKLHLKLSDTRDLVIPLRSESKSSESSDSSSSSIVEPSLLMYQSELCASLLEELENEKEPTNNSINNNNVEIHFDTRILDCDLDAMTIRVLENESTNDAEGATTSEFGPFDLIVGCDGVNSRVRAAIDKNFPEFTTIKERLPGFLKVVRLGYPVGTTSDDGTISYDPKAVSLLIPSGAFIEPTGDDGSCCILFSGRGSGDNDNDTSGLPLYLRETENITAVMEGLRTTFPRWKEESFRDIAEQLMAQDLSANTAFSVKCNTYHYKDKAVLVGDAAHATGGISGQGVNSALVDAVVLAESLQRGRGSSKTPDLQASLMEYSMRQVPEGLALYDLSFGPKPKGIKKKVSWGLKNLRDALFRGKLGIGEETLQTRLSLELTPFAEIRRERDNFYNHGDVGEDGSSFPSDDEFRRQLEALHNIRTEGNN